MSGRCQIRNSNQSLVVSATMWEERGEIWGILMTLRTHRTVNSYLPLKKDVLTVHEKLDRSISQDQLILRDVSQENFHGFDFGNNQMLHIKTKQN